MKKLLFKFFMAPLSLALMACSLCAAQTGSRGITDIREYFELKETIKLINLEIKNTLSQNAKNTTENNIDDINSLVDFIGHRVKQFNQKDTAFKNHYIKNLNSLYNETTSLCAMLNAKLGIKPWLNKTNGSVKISKKQNKDAKPQPKPYFASIDLRMLLSPSFINAHKFELENKQTGSVNQSSPTPITASVPQPIKTISGVEVIPPPPVINKNKVNPQNVKEPVLFTPITPANSEAKAPKNLKPANGLNKAEIFKAADKSQKPADSLSKEEIFKAADKSQKPAKGLSKEEIFKAADKSQKPADGLSKAEMSKAADKSQETNLSADTNTAFLRPLAVMVENHKAARPQSGLYSADVIYEIPVEGGITRFMGVYSQTPGLVGPVRSCREYFIDRALENDAFYAHCGASPLGYAYLTQSRINSVDEIKYPKTFFRDKKRKAPHNLYTTGKLLRSFIKDLNKNTLSKKSPALNYGPTQPMGDENGTEIKIKYHGDYTVKIKYENGLYKRYINDKPHIDRETKKPLTASTVVVQVVGMKTADKVGRQKINFIGTGDAYIFNNKKMLKTVWRKQAPNTKTCYYDKNGKEYTFKDGAKVWVQVVSPLHGLWFNGQAEQKPITKAKKNKKSQKKS